MQASLAFFSERFGGATALQVDGAWYSEVAGVVTEQVHLVVSHVTEEDLGLHLDEVIGYMRSLKRQLAQEVMAISIDQKLMLV